MLELQDEDEKTSYVLAMERAAAAEARADEASDEAAEEALAILRGEVEA